MKSLLSVVAIVAASLVEAAEPICWADGTWDFSGAPRGSLLTCNKNWWGARIYTGVTYAYEQAPNKQKDGKVAGVLLRGQAHAYNPAGLGHVSSSKAAPIAAIFDFHRPCRFNEIDLMPGINTNETATIAFSDDGKSWATASDVAIVSAVARLRFSEPKTGRYMRLTVRAHHPNAETTLARVFAWGEADVSPEFPEVVADIDAGDLLKFPDVAGKGVVLLPVRIPRLASAAKPKGGQPESVCWRMVRNETESRYFVAVNKTESPQTVAIAAPDFGKDIACELYVGGVMHMQRPPRPLTDQEMIEQQTTNRFFTGRVQTGKLDVFPFIPETAVPSKSFCRRYLANAAQVNGFPKAVALKPGEGCLFMLRVLTRDAAVGRRTGTLSAGSARLPVAIDVVDLTLGPQWMKMIYAYRAFTRQFPFESKTRFKKDVERYAEMGPTCTENLPEPRTKEAYFFKLVPNAHVGTMKWCDVGVDFGVVAKGKLHDGDTNAVKKIEASAHRLANRMRTLGYPVDRCLAFTHDEPMSWNAKSNWKMAEIAKRAEPELLLYADPCFWEKGKFASSELIRTSCWPEYNRFIDVSVPHFDLLFRPELKDLWFAPHKITAAYTHPATRFTTREFASLYAKGCDGVAYYCYFEPFSDAWDARTYNWGDPSYITVLPLETDVALTPQYECLRECAEMMRLYKAVEEKGRRDLVEQALSEMNRAWDRLNVSWKLFDASKPDTLGVRERLLSAF